MDKSDFNISPDTLYLNHAGVSPWSTPVKQAIQNFTNENCTTGARHYPDWLKTEAELRRRAARLINATMADIALLKSTSEAISMVASGVNWHPGDNVVITDQEFPSNRIPWEAQRSHGVDIRVAPIGKANNPETAILDLVDERTRVVAVSSVQYATGIKMNLKHLGDVLEQTDILFCVDAIQSLGISPVDVDDIHADFLMADGHKWLMAPEGLAVFYSRPNAREQLTLHEFGWHMIKNHGNYDTLEWEVADSARRFECGSPNMLGIYALHASLGLIERLGVRSIAEEIAQLIKEIIEQVVSRDYLTLLSSRVSERLAGIVTFGFRDSTINSASIQKELMRLGVICAHRGGGIRFSPHYHNTVEQIRQAFILIDSILGK